MIITAKQLRKMLEDVEPWRGSDWRKLPNGRIVRFVDWKRLATRNRA